MGMNKKVRNEEVTEEMEMEVMEEMEMEVTKEMEEVTEEMEMKVTGEIEMEGMEMEGTEKMQNGNRNRNHGMNYRGTKGVVGLTRWFEKIETVFNISNCPPKYQVKYVTCTLQDSALTWWNSHKRTIGIDAAYAMKWDGLMKLMAELYCLRNEI
uniref:Putative reverse transcriptase domain-containing protein n=1 Tax=Tanacetum cinerariifolium TaxID=118510 RepID=A0A699RA23_TANCI|nr:putative reverse transcriptase domain-containing protein [Tanacetum cinerariifolium]